MFGGCWLMVVVVLVDGGGCGFSAWCIGPRCPDAQVRVREVLVTMSISRYRTGNCLGRWTREDWLHHSSVSFEFS